MENPPSLQAGQDWTLRGGFSVLVFLTGGEAGDSEQSVEEQLMVELEPMVFQGLDGLLAVGNMGLRAKNGVEI